MLYIIDRVIQDTIERYHLQPEENILPTITIEAAQSEIRSALLADLMTDLPEPEAA